MGSDLAIVVILSVVTVVSGIWMPTLLPAPVRVLLGFVFTFVLPGYAITAALYPTMYSPAVSESPEHRRNSSNEAADNRTGSQSKWGNRRTSHPLSPAEGLVLTIGLSIAVVPLSVLLVSFAAVEIGPLTTLVAVAVITAFASIVAAIRRTRVTRDTGFPVSQVKWILVDRLRSEPTVRSSAEIITVILLLVSAGIAGAALAETRGGEKYTELSLLTEDEETGNLTADDYPTTLQVGEPAELVVSVENHEGEEKRYTVVIQLQSVSTSEEEHIVTRANTLNQFSFTVSDDLVTRQRVPITVEPTAEADRHRLVVLLYKGDAPTNPTVSNSYREVHIWTTISQ